MTVHRYTLELTGKRGKAFATVLIQAGALSRSLEWCADPILRERGARLGAAVDRLVLTLPESAAVQMASSLSLTRPHDGEVEFITMQHLLGLINLEGTEQGRDV
jgi:hypothetical protein